MTVRRDPVRDRVVAVTGAARGIGRATAVALECVGARVARGDIDYGPAGPDDLAGPALHLDVRDAESWEGFLEEVEATLGPLWGVVSNAGVNHLATLADQPLAGIDEQIDVNLRGAAYGIRAAARRLRREGEGRIVVVASVAGRLALPGGAVYCATKHGLVGLGEAARAELRGSNIAVSTVLPGMARTDMVIGQIEPRLAPAIPPEQVADAIIDALVSRRATTFVPSEQRVVAAVVPHLPAGLRDHLLRLTGATRAFSFDPLARAAYHERIVRRR